MTVDQFVQIVASLAAVLTSVAILVKTVNVGKVQETHGALLSDISGKLTTGAAVAEKAAQEATAVAPVVEAAVKAVESSAK